MVCCCKDLKPFSGLNFGKKRVLPQEGSNEIRSWIDGSLIFSGKGRQRVDVRYAVRAEPEKSLALKQAQRHDQKIFRQAWVG